MPASELVPSGLKIIAAPYLTPVNAQTFLTADRIAWDIPDIRWAQPMRKRLCIVDVDTRPLKQISQIWSGVDFKWDTLDQASPGRLNHYTYGKSSKASAVTSSQAYRDQALLHGYDYRYVRPEENKDRFAPWQKIPALAEALRDYDTVVYADADVVFANLHLPMELLFNRWELDQNTSVAMALDVDWAQCKDSKGRQIQNAGFIVLNHNPTTFEILDRWYNCPTEVANCSNFMAEWPAEQGAFGEYIRYDFPESIVEIPCNDAVGGPDQGGSACHGAIIRHYTMHKDGIKPATAEALNNLLSRALHADMIRKKKELFLDRTFNQTMLESGKLNKTAALSNATLTPVK